ncbi:MAG: sodium:proton antiporter [Clostridia bacterium]|nr:sodium:proton antiporter [Clostridia bacterium]
MNTIKKMNAFGWVSIAAGVLALVGLIIYIVSSVTGYMSGQKVNALPIVFAIIAIILLVGAPLLAGKVDSRILPVADLVAGVLLIIGACVFINTRVSLFADIYFIPVNYPASEEASLSISLAGMIFYIISFVAACVPVFAGSFLKKSAQSTELSK